jgi:hypothetical protein
MHTRCLSALVGPPQASKPDEAAAAVALPSFKSARSPTNHRRVGLGWEDATTTLRYPGSRVIRHCCLQCNLAFFSFFRTFNRFNFVPVTVANGQQLTI